MRYSVGEAMFKYSDKMEIEHWLAENHELVSEKTWKIKLRDNIIVRIISDGDTMTLALQSGEIDAAYGMPYASCLLFQNNKYKFTSTPTSRHE